MKEEIQKPLAVTKGGANNPDNTEPVILPQPDALYNEAIDLFAKAGDDASLQQDALYNICAKLANEPNSITRTLETRRIAKLFKQKERDVKKVVKELMDTKFSVDGENKMPGWAMQKIGDLEYNGFVSREDDEQHFGFYVRNGSSNSLTQISNFVFKYVMHIRDDDDDKRILEVNNGYATQYIDMPTKSMVSLDQFVTQMYQLEGNMLFEGDRKQLFKLLKVLGKSCHIAHELKTLGYQREGFFAFSNGIVEAAGNFVPMDQYGLVKFDSRHYYSPSASMIYKNRREDNDPYENDRYLLYTKSEITFSKWAGQFAKVYTENNSGAIGIACVFVATFRDIIFKVDNNCPHLSCYGESGSGKSKYAESLSNVSLNQLRPLNLFHSTDFALANRLTRYRNCLLWLDEFNDLTMKEERFEVIKAAYEGVLRERGKGGSKNKTEILKTQSFTVLTGQYLSTKDDMAAINRCVVLAFEKRSGERARNIREIKEYDILKGWEKEGLSSVVVELLRFRADFQRDYFESFAERFNELREAVQGSEYNERVLRNYNALLTGVHFFSSRLDLPFTYEEFFRIIKNEVIRLSRMISDSNALADFWNTVVFLMETGEIYDGFHYKVEEHASVSISSGEEAGGKRKTETKTFPAVKKMLFIRLTTVHKLYAEAYRRGNGKNGMPMSTLELYLNREKGFIGKSPSGWFQDKDGNKTNTSSYVFDYDALGVSLEQVNHKAEKVMTELIGSVVNLKQADFVGKPHLVFSHKHVSSYNFMGAPTEQTTWTKCYDEDFSHRDLYESGQALRITGELKVKSFMKDNLKQEARTLMVAKVEAIESQGTLPNDPEKQGAPDDDLPF